MSLDVVWLLLGCVGDFDLVCFLMFFGCFEEVKFV